MPDTGLKRSPRFQRGALVQLVKDLVGIVPNVIAFQYNPEKLSHTLTPWNPFEVDQTQRGAQAPTVQPFDPKESFSLTLEIDATEDEDRVAKRVDVADRLAALKKLTLPTEGLISDLAASARALVGKASEHTVRPRWRATFAVEGRTGTEQGGSCARDTRTRDVGARWLSKEMLRSILDS